MERFDPNPSLKRPIGVMLTGFTLFAGLDLGLGYVADAARGSDEAVKVAEQNGYSNVKVTDRDHFAVGFRGCGGDDQVKYEMSATAPNGVRADLLACGGVTKALTLRFPEQ